MKLSEDLYLLEWEYPSFNTSNPILHNLIEDNKHRIEGPELGVYCRGRLKREKEIYLPKYWKGLVHTNSISVQLQPVGAHQDIIVKRWDDEKIYLQAKGGMPIDCFYHVYAERKDVPALTVEYKGEKGDAPEGDIYPNIITT